MLSHSIVLNRLSFRHPSADRLLLHEQTVTIPSAVVGLIGPNGAGKTTLAGLIAGTLAPSGGTVSVAGTVFTVPQDLPQSPRSVAHALGIAPIRSALIRILEGGMIEGDLEVVDTDWDIDERALAALSAMGFEAPDARLLDRPVASLSGGQAMRVGLAAARLAGADWTILDEPTNNLDAHGRRSLLDALAGWGSGLLVVSHDRELLNTVSAILELRDGRLRLFGGALDAFDETVAQEQEAARAELSRAESQYAKEKQQRVAAQTTADRRVRYGRKMHAQKREPRIIMNQRKRAQQVSVGKLKDQMADREERARTEVAEAEAALRDTDRIRLDLGDTVVPAGRRVLDVGAALEMCLVGPERVRLTGRNGAGKSTLLDAIRTGGTASLEERAPRVDGGTWSVAAHVPVGVLAQDDTLPHSATAFDAVRSAVPTVDPHRVRETLAGLELRADAADRTVRALSGGERLKVALASVLLVEPAPQLLLLDEPTNNLDRESVAVLVQALADYRGGLLVVTHDDDFAERAGLTAVVDMASLRGIDVPAQHGSVPHGSVQHRAQG